MRFSNGGVRMTTEETLKIIEQLIERGYITCTKIDDNPFNDKLDVTEKGKRILNWGEDEE